MWKGEQVVLIEKVGERGRNESFLGRPKPEEAMR
jgi:hypothetical protein